MSQSDDSTHELQVQVSDPSLRVSVIDNADRIMRITFGESLSFHLRRGLHTNRKERDLSFLHFAERTISRLTT